MERSRGEECSGRYYGKKGKGSVRMKGRIVKN